MPEVESVFLVTYTFAFGEENFARVERVFATLNDALDWLVNATDGYIFTIEEWGFGDIYPTSYIEGFDLLGDCGDFFMEKAIANKK